MKRKKKQNNENKVRKFFPFFLTTKKQAVRQGTSVRDTTEFLTGITLIFNSQILSIFGFLIFKYIKIGWESKRFF